MYYVVSFDFDLYPKTELLTGPDWSNDIDVDFDAGIKIANSFPPLRLRHSVTPLEDTPDLLPTYLSNFLISSRIRQTLESAGVTNIDYYPVTILSANGMPQNDGYFLGNIIGRIACLNRETSIFDTMAGDEEIALDIEEMHLTEARIGDAKIFRLHEHPSIIIVAEDIKTSFQRSKIVGVKFSEAEGYCL
jgi:hypothetical protein